MYCRPMSGTPTGVHTVVDRVVDRHSSDVKGRGMVAVRAEAQPEEDRGVRAKLTHTA